MKIAHIADTHLGIMIDIASYIEVPTSDAAEGRVYVKPRSAEELAVATFAKSLGEAAAEFLQNPLGSPLLPNWNRVLAAIPDCFDRLQQAVEDESRELVEMRCA